jgi:8-oxo-dGTP diphosphatase
LEKGETMTEKWCKGVHAGTLIHVYRPRVSTWPEVLMIKRKGADGEGTWSVPGGWIDNGESPSEGALRELAEELGSDLKVTNVHYVGVTNDLHPEGTHSVTLHYFADWVEGEPVINEPDKITEVVWMGKEEIDTLNLFLPCSNYYNYEREEDG